MDEQSSCHLCGAKWRRVSGNCRRAFLAQCDGNRRWLGAWNGHAKTHRPRNATAKAVSRDISSDVL